MESILIVDDEESVRRTFYDWLTAARLDAHILAAADAESALLLANEHTIDLAVLDWNLGSGSDGLQLLEDLAEFNADVVAILVTGFAHQATPLDALRMGVRDYLDKSHDLNRETFVGSVRRQLDRIRPAKRQRQLNRSLAAFREAVEKVLPLVQQAAALNDPVPLPTAIRDLFRFLLRTTGATDGAMVIRRADSETVSYRAYDPDGQPLPSDLVPFPKSLAASVVSLQEPCILTAPEDGGAMEAQPFERGRTSILAAPLSVGPGCHVVLELFDKDGGPFTDADKRLIGAAGEFGAELLRQALAERQTHRILLDAVGVALASSESVAQSLHGTPQQRLEEPPPHAVMERIREGLGLATGSDATVDPDSALRLAEGVRVLAIRHGPAAVRHCVTMVESLRRALDELSGTE